ncbi:MAG: hypothetical protein AAFR46_12580 [Pseudomonadota bacterium]
MTAAMKVGFVHVPKCAGTALGQALYSAFGTRALHVSRIVARGAPHPDPHTLERGTLAWRLASSVPFLSGHFPIKQMRQLDRGFVFTVLRDPALRYFSTFSYFVSRATKAKFAETPERQRFRDMSFVEFDKEMSASTLARLVVGDILKLRGGTARPDSAELDAALLRFDRIYSGDMQGIAADVAAVAGRPAPQVARVNESQVGLRLTAGCSEEAFLDLLRRRTALDALVFDRATALFPQSCTERRLDDDALLAHLKSRYEIVFE